MFIKQIEYKKRHRIYDDFTATVAHCEEEACKLIEAGFDFVCDYNGNKIFRKRK